MESDEIVALVAKISNATDSTSRKRAGSKFDEAKKGFTETVKPLIAIANDTDKDTKVLLSLLLLLFFFFLLDACDCCYINEKYVYWRWL